jgi:hypothetical protein
LESPFSVIDAVFSLVRRVTAALPALALLVLPLTPLSGADPSGSVEPRLDPVRVGLNGAFKVGRWTPLEVAVHSAPGTRCQLEVDAPDPEGSVVTYRSEPETSPAAAGGDAPDSRQLGLLFKMGRLDGTLRVRVLDGERLLVNKSVRVAADPDADVPTPFRQSVYLVANIQAMREKADGGSGKPDIKRIARLLAGANDSQNPVARLQAEVVDVDSFTELPKNAEAYDSFDAIFIAERFDLDAARSAALERWVRGGGHLVISIGAAGADFPKTALASWLPVKVQGTVRLRDLSPIESFCRQSSRIMSAGEDPLDAAKLNAPGSQILIPSLAGPLLARVSYGLGRVTVFGLDLNAPPFGQWAAASDLALRLFDLEEGQVRRAQPSSTRLTQTGVTELGTQFDASLDEFPSVARFTIWHVMGLLAALVIVVGPIDYLLVHRLLRRPELTWVTFPIIALVGAGLAVYLSSAAKGERLLVNQCDILDVDAASGWTKSHAYSLIYSPENRRFNVTAQPEAPRHPAATTNVAGPAKAAPQSVRVGWHGRPETTFGGMYRTGGAEISHPSYSATAASRELEEVPIAIWSTKSLEAEWSAEEPGLVVSDLESRGLGHLGGTLRHHFSGPIEDWVVAFGHQVFRPRIDPKTDTPLPLPPDVPWSPQSASPRELGGYLTGATQSLVESKIGHIEELRVEHADYDPMLRDPLEILRMVTFHGEAGGSSYTGLLNGALRQMDWSSMLGLNRAVLIGRIRTPITHWTVDGKAVAPDQSTTLVRVLLPVRPTYYREE